MNPYPVMTRPVRVDARDLEAGDYVYLETSAEQRVSSPTGKPTRIKAREERAADDGFVYSVVLHFDDDWPWQWDVRVQTRFSNKREPSFGDPLEIESDEWVCPVWGHVVCEEPVTEVHDRADLALRSLRSALIEMQFPDPQYGHSTAEDPLVALFGTTSMLIEKHRQQEQR